MKLKFIERELAYSVWEDGVNSEKISYENIGFIPKLHPVLSINPKYSGLLEFDEIEQIYNFMKNMSRGILLK